MSCKHRPLYDEAVNETYCELCLERLPNESRPILEHTWWAAWMDQPLWLRTLAYLGAGAIIARVVGWLFT